ncbi:type IV pilus twitching motility protein PilT [Planococcus sp. CP5-4]|uniref:type IV pilus twitching motility protein PilT n=1 Tax=unclassified Planococcus (in: firmicutes) TaxID=2662419 RepID=UPI001C248827|nr:MULTISPECIES: type IV pilus twitching motility protein PilT [unclassified Planococcus (in: firmicutes)]MBU9672902.1 type IV pilus twitching motility protein PilT [Planococcus sp. CP5-4_YE]MBV0908674.1 type IV pilus twitching motility protein PilT [Planococcus sp. CP5-4_UN]MBW6063443.1 type IV pilus twitching motility protein PilT [Planococcus sp. CP5-4]
MPTTYIDKVLTQARNLNVSDIHLTTGIPPVFRMNGTLKRYGDENLTPDMTKEIAKALMPEILWQQFLDKGEMDFSYSLSGVARFRVNSFHQRGSISHAFRTIPTEIPTIADLQMPKTLANLAETPQGLILVTGPTGSGKSTTLAAMIRHINENLTKHIITLEDPIEYLHRHGSSIIDQREVGFDTDSFAAGLRAALRQDPDVVLVGEMRDLETISTAITAAETGHLVMATLHTSSAASTIERIIDVFPHGQQAQVRTQLAGILKAVVSQRLLPTADGKGRVAATEILINNPAVANLIRTEKVHQIPNVILTNRSFGMHMMVSSVQELLATGKISRQTAQPFLEGGE